MSNKAIFSLFAAVITVIFAFSAYGAEVKSDLGQDINALIGDSEITIKDLGYDSPGLLPTNPFYFLKEWNRKLAKMGANDLVKKAIFESQELNERMAEIKKMVLCGLGIKPITEAVAKYEVNLDELNFELNSIKNKGNNLNIDDLTTKIIDNSVKHKAIMEELKAKFLEDEEFGMNINRLERKTEKLLAELSQVANNDLYSESLNNSLSENYAGILGGIKSIELLENLDKQMGGENIPGTNSIKEEIAQNIEDTINGLDFENAGKILSSEIFVKSIEDSELGMEVSSRIKFITELSSTMEFVSSTSPLILYSHSSSTLSQPIAN